MPQCSRCQSDTQLVNSISKKTGKPYSGYKCNACGNMDFIKTPTYQKPPTPQAKSLDLELLPYALKLGATEENAIRDTIDMLKRVLNPPIKLIQDEPEVEF